MSAKVGFSIDPDGGLIPDPTFQHDGRKIWVLYSLTGRQGKSTWLNDIDTACNRSDGCGSVKISSMDNLNNVLHLVTTAFKDPPDKAYILIDLPRAFADKLAEASFWGNIETVMDRKISSGKYEGNSCDLPNPPIVIIVSNECPIKDVDKHGRKLPVPKMYVSSDRLIDSVFTIEIGRTGYYELVPDTSCNEMARKVDAHNAKRQRVAVEAAKQGETLTGKELFESLLKDHGYRIDRVAWSSGSRSIKVYQSMATRNKSTKNHVRK